jgi:hypothetical protein
MRTFFRAVLPAVCVAALLANGWAPPPCPADDGPPAGAEIDKLIAQLGSENFDVREEATSRLRERPDAIPALRNARQSGDTEVRRRAAQILDVLDPKEKERAFAQFRKLALDGAIDQALEKLVRCEKWDDETACWQVLAEVAGKLTDLEQKAFGKASLPATDQIPARDFRKYLASVQPEITAGRRLGPRQLIGTHFVARGEEIQPDSPKISSVLAATGRIQGSYIQRSVVLAGDSVDVSYVDDSLIVCDGDFTARFKVLNSLIIARGDVWFQHPVDNCRVITSGHVHYADARAVKDTKVQENEPKPLGFIHFFDPAQVGLDVESVSGGVRFKETGKAFAGAGFRRDDLVVALNGKAVKDADTFRRLLRGQLAVGAELVFTVRRVEEVIRVLPKE